MKKIAIVTLYDDINIGNKLQNFAVQCFFESLGYKCETIRHWEMAHNNFTLRAMKLNIIRLLGYPRSSAQKLRLEKQRKKKFKGFSDKYLRLGLHVKIRNLPKELYRKYDYFVTGSDQVWHNWTNSKEEIDYFFLQFAKKWQRLTIAPSFGKDSIEQCYLNDYIRGLNGIPIITCREKQGGELVHALTDRDAEVILDPTMLIEQKEWSDIEKKPTTNMAGKYILVYGLGGLRKDLKQSITDIAKERDLLIIDICDTSNSDIYMTTPDEFIYYIHHAELVVTDSFHACVFSILFHTNFVVFDRETKSMGNMSSRLDTLLSIFNLIERKITNCDKEKLFNTNFSNVDNVLYEERKRVRKIYKRTFIELERVLNTEEGKSCK